MELYLQDLKSSLKEIFVGRIKELENLNQIFNSIQNSDEHLVYVLLNTPGVGKTSLIQHFGKQLEQDGKGLFVSFQASDNFDSSERINKRLFRLISDKVKENKKFIESYISIHKPEKKKIKLQKWDDLFKILQKMGNLENITLGDLIELLELLSAIIPIFFATDEIQELQKIKISKPQSEPETGLHYFSRFIKDLLRLPIFLLLSGTRFHILSQIGEKIGSPLRQKVRSVVISNFSVEEITDYVEKIRGLTQSIKSQNNSQYNNQNHILNNDQSNDQNIRVSTILDGLLSHYFQFLLGFSGGHPRTIAFITDLFFFNLSTLTEKDYYQNYSKFTDFFLPLVEKKLVSGIITSDIREELLRMTSHRNFGWIKSWLMNGAYNESQFLGQAPRDLQSPQTSEELDQIIYNLMNMGLIVQNAQLNYYITSYFHFLAFLSIFSDPHDQFLRSVLYDKHFQFLCGSHGGFGFVFEHILASVLFRLPDERLKLIQVPLIPSRIRMIQEIKTQPNWAEFKFESDVLYHLPWAKLIDFCIVQNNILIFIQITTGITPNPDKIVKMTEMESIFSHISINNEASYQIKHWFISLNSVKFQIKENSNINITAGDQLIPLLGQELFARLKDVKQLL